MTNLISALSFIESQLRQIQYPVTGPGDSTIAPSQTWPADWTGEVTGTFDLVGVGYPTVQRCPITVTSPAGTIADSYRGTVNGMVQGLGGATGYTVQAYKLTDSEYVMPSSAPVGAGGAFALDLSTTPSWQTGTWNLAVLNKAGVQDGAYWPSYLSYENLEVQSWVISDTAYLITSQAANANNTFSFATTQPGRKMFQLMDTSAGDVLAAYVPTTGNVRSYLVAKGEPGYGTDFIYQSYLYDQSLCLVAAITAGQPALAQQLVSGLLQFQTGGAPNDGGFIISGQQLSPGYGDLAYRTGAHAIATYALLAYMAYAPGDDSQDYAGAAGRALAWLLAQQLDSGPAQGLFTGGSGITWCSTEHAFDIWHAFVKASTVLHETSWLLQANSLEKVILRLLWNQTAQQFNQGYDPGSGVDTGNPLDCHSWGAIWANCIGRQDIAGTVLEDTALKPFLLTQNGVTGYQPEYAADPSGDYPGATPTIWSEGTFFTAYAFRLLGNTTKAASIIAGIDPEQQSRGSFAYCTVYDPIYDLSPSQSVIGPAWAILAAAGSGIWTES